MKKKIQTTTLKESDVKVGTPAEALWTRVRDASKTAIQTCKDELIIQEGILRLSDEMIAKEQGKL